jgi:NTP pyrophosphatase (non-canonical NTP hydrolase)
MKIATRPTVAIPASRIAQRLRAEALSSRTVERLERELADELDTVSTFERSADADTRRDALERAVRRVWGSTL